MVAANVPGSPSGTRTRSYITITDLEVECIIGIHPHERKMTQRLLFDVRVDVDIAKAAAADDIAAATDYDDIARVVTSCAVDGRYHLVETCVTDIIAELKKRHPHILGVSIVAKKPAANPKAAYVSVELHDNF